MSEFHPLSPKFATRLCRKKPYGKEMPAGDKRSIGKNGRRVNSIFGEIAHKILGLFGGLFSGDSGDFRGRGGEGVFSTIWRGLSGVLRLIGTHRFLPPRIPDLYD